MPQFYVQHWPYLRPSPVLVFSRIFFGDDVISTSQDSEARRVHLTVAHSAEKVTIGTLVPVSVSHKLKSGTDTER
jgi:hypothetical protein